jgi:phosphoribosylformimino-5-aminoimidazole carboxamide ribonucleotide (ProFAR) isomerase
VAFEVLPAIDLQGGRVARMTRGDRSTIEHVDLDPLRLVAGWRDAGAGWVHVVDLDATLEGRWTSAAVLDGLVALGVRIEAGGGLTEEGVDEVLGRGAARSVLGAAAFLEPGVVERVVGRHGDRVAVGLDVRGGRVAPRGTGRVGPPAEEALARVAAARPKLLIYTDADRDGALAGPDLDGLAAAAGAARVPVLASGGVRSADDVSALARMQPSVAGVIVGRAIQERLVTLPEALAAASID